MEQESQKKSADRGVREPPNAPVLCVNGCGFFGSPAANNLCSKCHRDYLSASSKESSALEGGGAPRDDEGAKAARIEGGTSSEKLPPNRCGSCGKRVGLTGFKCRCESTFCSVHRYSDKHDCVFDYKSAGQDAIAKANPVVKADKVEKI